MVVAKVILVQGGGDTGGSDGVYSIFAPKSVYSIKLLSMNKRSVSPSLSNVSCGASQE